MNKTKSTCKNFQFFVFINGHGWKKADDAKVYGFNGGLFGGIFESCAESQSIDCQIIWMNERKVKTNQIKCSRLYFWIDLQREWMTLCSTIQTKGYKSRRTYGYGWVRMGCAGRWWLGDGSNGREKICMGCARGLKRDIITGRP
jgi:hypothetical protein